MLSSSVFISALFAGAIAILVTLAIERWGGLTGGLLGTIPSTVVPAAAGMYIVGGEDLLIESMAIVPFGMLINGLFLCVWVVLPPYLRDSKSPLILTTVGALVVWAVCGSVLLFGMSLAFENGISAMTVSLTGLTLLVVFAVAMNWHPKPSPKGQHSVTVKVLVLRGSAAALAIGIAVWMSAQGQPLIAGLAAVFPAIFLTSMVALWVAQGPTVPQGAAGPMTLGGVSVGVYACAAMYSLPSYGLYIGSLIAWLLAVVGWSLPAYVALRRHSANLYALGEASSSDNDASISSN